MILRRSAEVLRLDPEASDHGRQYSTNFLYTQRPPRLRRHTNPQTSRSEIDRLGMIIRQRCQASDHPRRGPERTAESVSLLLAISDSRYSKDAEPGAAARDGWQRQKSRCQPLGCLTVCERYSDVTRCIAGAKAHQHAALLVGARSFKRLANVTGFRNALSGNLQNHVALLKPAFGSRAVRFDLRDNDAFLACAACLARC